MTVILLCIKLILQSLCGNGTSYRLRILLKGRIILNDSAIAVLVLALMSVFFSFRAIHFLRCTLWCNRWLHLIKIQYLLGIFTHQHFNLLLDLQDLFVGHIEMILHLFQFSGNFLRIILLQVINEVKFVVTPIQLKLYKKFEEFLFSAHFLLGTLAWLLIRLLRLARLVHIRASEHWRLRTF